MIKQCFHTGWVVIFVWMYASFANQVSADRIAVLENNRIAVSVNPANGQLSVIDHRSGIHWQQPDLGYVRLERVEVAGNGLYADLRGPGGIERSVEMRLENAELLVTLSGNPEHELTRFFGYPYPFLPNDDDLLILPEHGGIGVPVRDFAIMNRRDPGGRPGELFYNRRYRFYCGHDLSMTFWGYAGEKASLLCIAETPNDASVRIHSIGDRITGGIEWDPSFSTFGHDRVIRFVFLEDGGYNEMCKRYRDYALEQGWLKTLSEKAQGNPNVERFSRNALIWVFEPVADILVPEWIDSGMDQITVMAPFLTPGEVHRMRDQGVLSGVYDNLRSVLSEAHLPKVFRVCPTDVRPAYPDHIIRLANGEPYGGGWPKRGYGGQVFRTMDVRDAKQPQYADQRLRDSLQYRPMAVRFYDTITAYPWTECHAPDAPTTRSMVREARAAVLRLSAVDHGQVTGGEAGHIYAAPYASYFEGLHHSRFFHHRFSGHPLEVHSHQVAITAEHRELMAVDYQYRLPLWQLVAGDSAIAFPRWNSPHNKVHDDEWWDHMDRWSVLYAVPPMYMFFNRPESFWEQYRDRYLQSYRDIVKGVLEHTAGQEMMRHEHLTEDKTVQQTTFANGVQIVVNFGGQAFISELGEKIDGGKFAVILPK